MNEIIKNWLINMYETEIEESKWSISNERCFQKGASGIEIDFHEQNINTLEEYIEILEMLKNGINEKTNQYIKQNDNTRTVA